MLLLCRKYVKGIAMNVPHKLAILIHKLVETGCGPVRKQGEEFRFRCPAHADSVPSLYVKLVEDKILVSCNAGCTTNEVCDRLDHPVADLFFDGDEPWIDLDCDLDSTGVAHDVDVRPGACASGAADPATVDEESHHIIYTRLLEHLELSTEHFDSLRNRGLPPDEICRRGYRTVDAGKLRAAVDELLREHGADRLLTIPGFCEKDGRVFFNASRGTIIPVRGLSGNIAALKIRHDAGYVGSKYTWASSSQVSCGNLVHVPLGVAAPSQTVRLTEGELKADVATALSQLPTISAPGVGNWRLAVPALRELGVSKVLLAMDQDGKPGTMAIIEKALYGLSREGFVVELEWWDGTVAKGVDDLLAAGHQPEVLAGLRAAVRIREALSPPSTQGQEVPEPEPEPFPVDVFPPALATYCREVAIATGTPPDFAAAAMLATAGAAIGNSRALCIKENTWYEGPRFYVALVGDPTSGKTPVMELVVKPHQEQQTRILKEYKNAVAAHELAKAECEQAAKQNRTLPSDERVELPTVPPKPSKPERFIVVDATVESLAPILEQNPRGLLMPQDEGVGWVRAMGQYKGGRGADRQFWLSAWSGKSHLVDRKSDGGVPICIPRPFINVIGNIQPDMLGELADHQGRNDGFLYRILFTFPRASSPDWTDEFVSVQSSTAWENALAALRRLEMKELDDGTLGYRVIHFSDTGRPAWVAWWDAHAEEMRADLPVSLIGPWGKLRTYAARLALVLHCLWLTQGNQEDKVDAADVARAVRLVQYFKSHLRIVYDRLRQTPEDNRLLEVVDWIRRNGGRCRARDLVRAKKVIPTEKAKKLLKELEERGYGRVDWLDAANGRKVQEFVFDPN
jgi:hypothetical protein